MSRWNDDRLAKAYDAVASVLRERRHGISGHPLLNQIEALDGEPAREKQAARLEAAEDARRAALELRTGFREEDFA